jgi:hypothetical protein
MFFLTTNFFRDLQQICKIVYLYRIRKKEKKHFGDTLGIVSMASTTAFGTFHSHPYSTILREGYQNIFLRKTIFPIKRCRSLGCYGTCSKNSVCGNLCLTHKVLTYVEYRAVSRVFVGGAIFWKTRDVGLASYSIISLRSYPCP